MTLPLYRDSSAQATKKKNAYVDLLRSSTLRESLSALNSKFVTARNVPCGELTWALRPE